MWCTSISDCTWCHRFDPTKWVHRDRLADRPRRTAMDVQYKTTLLFPKWEDRLILLPWHRLSRQYCLLEIEARSVIMAHFISPPATDSLMHQSPSTTSISNQTDRMWNCSAQAGACRQISHAVGVINLSDSSKRLTTKASADICMNMLSLTRSSTLCLW